MVGWISSSGIHCERPEDSCINARIECKEPLSVIRVRFAPNDIYENPFNRYRDKEGTRVQKSPEFEDFGGLEFYFGLCIPVPVEMWNVLTLQVLKLDLHAPCIRYAIHFP